MKVSINLVTWNGKKYLPYCLDSIAKQTFRDFSLLILDNGSTDETVEYLKNFRFPISDFRLIFNDKNVGFAGGHNQALKLTESEYVLMLNQDIVLEPNFLEIIVKFMEAHSEVGAATGKLLRWDFAHNTDLCGLNADKCGHDADLRGLSGKTNFLDSCGLKIFKNHRVIELGAGEMDGERWNVPKEVFGVSGAAPVYRRKALEDVALGDEYFDKDFFSYKEDVDLAYRLRLRGWQAWFLPLARAYHDRRARTSGSNDAEAARQRKNKSAFVNYHSYKNHLFFLWKNVPLGIWLRYGHRIKWYEFKKFVYLLFFEPRTLKAWGEFFRKFPKMWRKRKYIMAHRKVTTAEIKRWLE